MRVSLLGMLLVGACCGSGPKTAPATVRPQPAAQTDLAGDPAERAAMVERVRAETRHAWNSYVKYAWGHDELRPATHSARDWYGASLLITPVDALDTLVLLGLTGEAAAPPH